MPSAMALPPSARNLLSRRLISVSDFLTSVGLLGNKFDDETAMMLLKLKEEKPALLTLCGLQPDQTEAIFVRKPFSYSQTEGSGLGPADAKLLAPEIVSKSC